MKTAAAVLTGIVALLHIGFLVLEMFLWQDPIGRQVFGTTESFAEKTHFMAQNQGLYNGFLAVGLLWGLMAKKRDVKIFFLSCVIIAGIFGAVTVSPKIVIVQALPALMALAFTILSTPRR